MSTPTTREEGNNISSVNLALPSLFWLLLLLHYQVATSHGKARPDQARR